MTAAPRTRRCPSTPRCSGSARALGVGEQQVDADGGPARQVRRARRARRAAPPCPTATARSCPSWSAPCTPSRCSMRSISAGGNGAPPTMMRSSVGTSPPMRVEMLDQAQPHRGDAHADGHALGIDQRGQAARRRCGGRAAPACAPAAGAANGRPQALAWNIGTTASTLSRARDRHDVGLQRAQRVQVARAMRVGHALGRAGGARGEAQAAGRGLVEIAPGRLRRARAAISGSSAQHGCAGAAAAAPSSRR